MIKFRPKTVKPVKSAQPENEKASAAKTQPVPAPKAGADKKAI